MKKNTCVFCVSWIICGSAFASELSTDSLEPESVISANESTDSLEEVTDKKSLWKRIRNAKWLFKHAKSDEEVEAETETTVETEVAAEVETVVETESEAAMEEAKSTVSGTGTVPLEADESEVSVEIDVVEPETGIRLSAYTTSAVMSLEDLVQLVSLHNDRIAYQRMEWAIATEQLKGESALYEPSLTASYKYSDSNTPNTTEEEFRRSFAPVFDEQYRDLIFGIEGMVPTGGKVKVSYTFRNIENNIQPDPIKGKENKTFVGVSFTQPLLKGAGGRKLVETAIRVAEKDEAIARQTYRQALFETVANASVSFWDLFLAQEKVKLRQQSVRIAEKVMDDEEVRAAFGRSAETDVLVAESGVAQRRAQAIAADQGLLAAQNELRLFLADLPSLPDIGNIVADAKLVPGIIKPVFTEALTSAFSSRPEYLASRLRAEKEDVHTSFAKNNKLPQLDLVASYGLNGLDESYRKSYKDAFDRDHKSMFIGLEYSMLLIGNRKAKSELAAAQYRKQQALLEIRAAEISIRSGIDTAIHNLQAARSQVDQVKMMVESNQKLLDVEFVRFESGQSNSRQLLEREEFLNRALETELDIKVNFQKALVGFRLAEGSLLRQYGLEN